VVKKIGDDGSRMAVSEENLSGQRKKFGTQNQAAPDFGEEDEPLALPSAPRAYRGHEYESEEMRRNMDAVQRGKSVLPYQSHLIHTYRS
jgi:hypothetical protein